MGHKDIGSLGVIGNTVCGQQEIPSRVIPSGSIYLEMRIKRIMKNVDNKDIIRDSYLLKVKLKLLFSNFWDVEMELFGLY